MAAPTRFDAFLRQLGNMALAVHAAELRPPPEGQALLLVLDRTMPDPVLSVRPLADVAEAARVSVEVLSRSLSKIKLPAVGVALVARDGDRFLASDFAEAKVSLEFVMAPVSRAAGCA